MSATLFAALLLGGGACSTDDSEPQVASIETAENDRTAENDTSGPAAGESDENAVEQYLARQQAYVDCARENGAPEMRDPDEFGRLVMADLIAIEGDVARKVQATCGHYIEGNTMPADLAERQEAITAGQMTTEQKQLEIDFAKCMQENGVPEYPDPQPNGLPTEPEWDRPDSSTPTPPGLGRAREACLPLIGRDAGAE